MAFPFKKKIKVLLEKGCDFQVGVRKGRVLELRPEGYHVFWEEWCDPDGGECHESAVSIYVYDAVITDNSYGTLQILKRPLAHPSGRERIRRSERVATEVALQKFRKQHVLAIQDMLDAGELDPVRDDFCAKIVSIVANGAKRYREYLAALSMREGKRAGQDPEKQ